jgi:hypothetical protein
VVKRALLPRSQNSVRTARSVQRRSFPQIRFEMDSYRERVEPDLAQMPARPLSHRRVLTTSIYREGPSCNHITDWQPAGQVFFTSVWLRIVYLSWEPKAMQTHQRDRG